MQLLLCCSRLIFWWRRSWFKLHSEVCIVNFYFLFLIFFWQLVYLDLKYQQWFYNQFWWALYGIWLNIAYTVGRVTLRYSVRVQLLLHKNPTNALLVLYINVSLSKYCLLKGIPDKKRMLYTCWVWIYSKICKALADASPEIEN